MIAKKLKVAAEYRCDVTQKQVTGKEYAAAVGW
jgi:hypothetical protein